MRERKNILFRWLCLAELALMCTAVAGAQLSTSTSGSLSNPLDASGPSSGAAPTISGAIEPGANNLMVPDDRLVPYDAIGASIVSTSMSPSVTQFYPLMLNRMPYQLDSTLKDATVLTGQRNILFANIVDIIRDRPNNPASSAPAASFGSMTALPSALLQNKVTPGAGMDVSSTFAQQSFWNVGGSTVTLQAMTPPASSASPLQWQLGQAQLQSGQSPGLVPTALRDLSKSNDLLLKKKDQIQGGGGSDADSSTPEKAQDFSRSPLEAPPAYGDQSATTVADSPFESLDKYSFLNPDITLSSMTSFRRSLSRREKLSTRQKMLAASLTGQEPSTLTGQEFSSRTQTRLRSIDRLMKSREMSSDQLRLKKLSSANQAVTKPRWHNPILQQMETESNSNRQ